MTNAPSNPYFAKVAEQWDEIRSDYFTEHLRDAAANGFAYTGALSVASALAGATEHRLRLWPAGSPWMISGAAMNPPGRAGRRLGPARGGPWRTSA